MKVGCATTNPAGVLTKVLVKMVGRNNAGRIGREPDRAGGMLKRRDSRLSDVGSGGIVAVGGRVSKWIGDFD